MKELSEVRQEMKQYGSGFDHRISGRGKDHIYSELSEVFGKKGPEGSRHRE